MRNYEGFLGKGMGPSAAGAGEDRMRVVFLGAPGVGKGTQADRIAAQFKIAKISTGDLCVRRFASDPVGREAKQYMDQGRLVPDSVVIGLVRDKLAEAPSANGFVLTGFRVPFHRLKNWNRSCGRPSGLSIGW